MRYQAALRGNLSAVRQLHQADSPDVPAWILREQRRVEVRFAFLSKLKFCENSRKLEF